jgi:acyl-CoA thioesterase-1
VRLLCSLALLALGLAVPAVAPAAEERVIVAFGDSLTAGFGVDPELAWPAFLQERLAREGYPYRVVNAGVSGDTTAGGLRRVDWVLRAQPEIVVVALGANDGLRGQPVAAMQANLAAIVARLQGAGARVLLARVPLMPFLLDGVAADPRLNQADGIHPNAEGHRLVAERVWPYLLPLLKK